jgi:tetratricopeptide (TPR) repeat protein
MFRKVLLAVFVIAALSLSAQISRAQTILDLPRDSQRAQVMQRVGLTSITISYHRPLVKGRKVWGGLVPFGQVWRAGANENTTIEFSDPVSIEGQSLAKGIYGLHTIPGENEWTLIFSKNSTQWGSFFYNQAEDALRVTVKPQASDIHEALTYDFDEVGPDSTTITLRWEKLAVPFHVGVNLKEIVSRSLQEQLRGGSHWIWESWDEAASYLLDNGGNLEEALKDADHSIQVEERFDNVMTRSRALEALGRKDAAVAARKKAIDMSSAIQLHSMARGLQLRGDQTQAFDLFRINIARYPDNWLIHSEIARLACAKGDFDGAVKEMKLAVAGAPAENKAGFERLVKRLEAKEDINK